jgi:hypothetical protein
MALLQKALGQFIEGKMRLILVFPTVCTHAVGFLTLYLFKIAISA